MFFFCFIPPGVNFYSYTLSFEVIFTKYLYIFDAIRYVRQIYMDLNLTKREIIVLPQLLLLHGGGGNVR